MASQSAITNDALIKALRTIIDLPKGITALTLTMRIGQPPRVEYSTYVYPAVIDGNTVKQETRAFELVRKG